MGKKSVTICLTWRLLIVSLYPAQEEDTSSYSQCHWTFYYKSVFTVSPSYLSPDIWPSWTRRSSAPPRWPPPAPAAWSPRGRKGCKESRSRPLVSKFCLSFIPLHSILTLEICFTSLELVINDVRMGITIQDVFVPTLKPICRLFPESTRSLSLTSPTSPWPTRAGTLMSMYSCLNTEMSSITERPILSVWSWVRLMIHCMVVCAKVIWKEITATDDFDLKLDRS